MQVSFDVYNLEFRDWCNEMTIGGYRFTRVADYSTQAQNLHHSITVQGEIPITPTTGTHRLTAHAAPPAAEAAAVLPWTTSDATALADITLLLSIFTSRHVFACRSNSLDDGNRVITADPREFRWGGLIAASIPYEKSSNQETHENIWAGDQGLETHLNAIHQLVNTGDWSEKYRNGYYLILFREALQQRTVESAFTQCWTVWEHLFSILNDSWMTKKTVQQTSAVEKITFLLVSHAVRENLQDKEKKRLEVLASIRNRIVHFGRFPKADSALDDAVLFIRMTELIVAKTLDLEPSGVFDTMDKLENFLTNATKNAQDRGTRSK